ncbi:MAG: acetylxylan esterase [Actinobacteria bacterium]|nr:acetylxylan esterase [Actinomycetota bacterium]
MDELKKYRPRLTKRDDFENFWKDTRAISKNEQLNEEIIKIDYIVKEISASKIYYDGFGGARICGFYLVPNSSGPHPVILWFHGYGDDKQKINYYLKWVLLGYAILAIDIRGQNGESTDNKTYPAPSAIEHMTKGIFSKVDYYYRGVYMDCVRAIDFLATRSEIDIERLCVTGASQGGGLTLATAALDDRPKLTIAEIPYLCHFNRAVEWAEDFENVTYLEFRSLIKKYPEREEEMFDTLSYFDNLNLCNWIKARTVISCAMRDTCCPPSTIFAVYNHMKAQKHLEVMPFYEHAWDTLINFDEKRLEYIKTYL